MPESKTLTPPEMSKQTDQEASSHHAAEMARGERFAFGKNWASFLELLDEGRIRAAEGSLQRMLGIQDLHGLSFLDVGCGSGLFSLAARRLGARVHSFDFDPQSAGCAGEMKRRFFKEDPLWTVEVASVLDREFLTSLGTYDIVYSWGVLHHTGRMWDAMENVLLPLASSGTLFLALYNTNRWTPIHVQMKKLYVHAPHPIKPILLGSYSFYKTLRGLVKDLCVFRNPTIRYRSSGSSRGMSWWTDVVDWLGGYPFETALPEEVFQFYRERGLVLERLRTANGGYGNNEFVFRKASG